MEIKKAKFNLNEFYFDKLDKKVKLLNFWYLKKRKEGFAEKYLSDILSENFCKIIRELFIKPEQIDDFDDSDGLCNKQIIIREFGRNYEKYERKKNECFISDTFDNLNKLLPYTFKYITQSEFKKIVNEYAYFKAYQKIFKRFVKKVSSNKGEQKNISSLTGEDNNLVNLINNSKKISNKSITADTLIKNLIEESIKINLKQQSFLVLEDEDIIFIKDAMNITNLTRSTIYGKVYRNTIPFIKNPGSKKLMFSKKALLEWLQNKD